MLSKLNTILYSPGLRQSLITVSGSIIASGCAAVATILITRQLGPEKYGEFSVAFAILLIIVRLTDLGMTTVVQKYASKATSKQETINIFSYTTKMRLLALVTTWIIGILFFKPLSTLLNFSNSQLLLSAFLLAGATAFYEHFQTLLQALQRFPAAALSNIFQAILKIIIAVLLLLIPSLSVSTLFFLYMVAPVLPYILFYAWFPQWLKLDVRKNFDTEKALVKNIAFHSTIAFVTAGIIENVDLIFVQKQLNTYEAGLLGGISRVTMLFSIIAYSLANVLNTRVARYSDQATLKTYIKKASLISIATLLTFVCIAPFSSQLISFTIGSEYLPGLPIMYSLLASAIITIAVVPFSALFFSFDKPNYFSLSGLLQLVIIIGGNTLFLSDYGLLATANTRLVARVCLFVFTVAYAWYSYQKINKRFK